MNELEPFEEIKMSGQCCVTGCYNLIENHDNGLCAKHNRDARKKSAPKTKARKTRIPKQSEEGKERMAVYMAIRELFLSDYPDCLAHSIVHPEPVGRRKELATEIHHKKGRNGDLLFDVRYWLPVCRSCHETITLQSEWAYNEGLSLSRHQTETI